MSVKLIIPRDVYVKTMWWIDHTDKEISGFGKVKIDKEKNEIVVLSSHLFPQVNGPAETDIKAEDLAAGSLRILSEPGELRWWWHSHVNMGVFWSSVDMANMRSLGAAGWFISTVFNKRREMKTAFLAGKGNVLPWGSEEVFIDDISTNIIDFLPQASIDSFKKEYDENVKIEKPTYVQGYWGQQGTYESFMTPVRGLTGGNSKKPQISKKMLKRMKRLHKPFLKDREITPYTSRFDEDELRRLRICSLDDSSIQVLSKLTELDTEEIIYHIEKGDSVEQLCIINNSLQFNDKYNQFRND